MRGVKRVLLPTDGSEHANVALGRAVEVCKLLKAPLHALYVVDTPSVQTFPPESLLVDMTKVIRKDAEAALQAVRKRTTSARVKATFEVREGHPVEEILESARPSDLIVISTHGRRGLARMLMGSVAESVIRGAPCPVLVVRPQKR